MKLNKLAVKLNLFLTENPSIVNLSCVQGLGGAGANPSLHRAKSGEHPGQVASLSGPHIDNHSHSHSHRRAILETAISLACMSLGGGRKPEQHLKTLGYFSHACMCVDSAGMK